MSARYSLFFSSHHAYYTEMFNKEPGYQIGRRPRGETKLFHVLIYDFRKVQRSRNTSKGFTVLILNKKRKGI